MLTQSEQPMEIIKASDMGFCFGVRRAVEMMEREAEGGLPIVSLGSVVHNPQVVGRLRERGLDVISTLDDADGRRLAITAHGVGPSVIEAAARRGLEVVDTTCPIVTRAQRWARKLVEEGFAVIVYGDPEHKETKGIVGWAGGKAYTLRSENDIASLPADLPSRVGVLVQTTHTEANFASFVNKLLATRMHQISELRVINTLCNATTGQQAAARALAHEVDLMVVVGGKESANTRHLREVCEEEGTRAYHIETPEELEPEWFAGIARVGVTAGASTPDSAVESVIARLEAIAGNAPPDRQEAEVSPLPLLRDLIAGRMPSTDADGLTADERERIERWRRATLEERGRALVGLLRTGSRIGRLPPEQPIFPGFRATMCAKRPGND